MAIRRVGCCTQLLYETTRASKNTVKVATPAMLHGRGDSHRLRGRVRIGVHLPVIRPGLMAQQGGVIFLRTPRETVMRTPPDAEVNGRETRFHQALSSSAGHFAA